MMTVTSESKVTTIMMIPFRLRACCMQLTANEHEYDWENLLVVRVGGNVAEAHGDETGEAKVEASAVPTLVGRWVMWAFPKNNLCEILSDSGGVT